MRWFCLCFCVVVLLGCGGQTSELEGEVKGYTPTKPLVIATSGLASGVEGQWYSFYVVADGGRTPYKWVCSGLPEGLHCSCSNGRLRIYGTPKVGTAGTYSVSMTVTDADGEQASCVLSLEIFAEAGGVLRVVTESLPPIVAGKWQECLVYATGGKKSYRWSCAGLPGGLSAGQAGGALRIFGKPSTSLVGSSFTITVSVRDSSSPQQTASKDLTLRIVSSEAIPLQVGTSSLPAATEKEPYTACINAIGGTPPYAWSVDGLPSGVSWRQEGDKVIIEGTPDRGCAGDHSVSVFVSDSSTPQQTATKEFILKVEAWQPDPLEIETDTLPPAREGEDYRAEVKANGGEPPYNWVVDGLPAGLDWSVENGMLVISGVPDAGVGGSSYDVSVEVTDSGGRKASRTYNVWVAGGSGTPPNVPLPYDPQPNDTPPLVWSIYVRVCPDADVNFLQDIAERIKATSKNLWNMSGGQFYIARAHISDNWGHACERDTYEKWAKEEGVSVIIENLDQWYVLYIGRALGYAGAAAYGGTFLVVGGKKGYWNVPVLTHEWGHAKLALHDEYGTVRRECEHCIMSGSLGKKKLLWCDCNNCLLMSHERYRGECWDHFVAYFVNLIKQPECDHTKDVPGLPETYIEIVDR